MSFDLGGIDWSRWQAVHLDFLALVDGSSDTSFDLYFNGDATTRNVYWRFGRDYGDGCTLGSVLANAGQSRVWADRITLPVGKCPERLIRAVSSDGCGRHDSLRYSQLATLHLQAPAASTRMWEDAKVIEAAHLLVEVWGETHKTAFENKFPRIYPVKDSMLVNIVWSKEKRASMAKISEAYSEDEKRILIDESEKIRELLDKLKEDEKVSIEVQLQSAGGSLVYEKIEVPRFGGLSKEEIKAYVKEAKQAVINYLKELNEQNKLELRFDEDRIAMDSYTRLYGVYDKNGKEIPMIVRSYKGIQYRYFELLPYELDLLEERAPGHRYGPWSPKAAAVHAAICGRPRCGHAGGVLFL